MWDCCEEGKGQMSKFFMLASVFALGCADATFDLAEASEGGLGVGTLVDVGDARSDGSPALDDVEVDAEDAADATPDSAPTVDSKPATDAGVDTTVDTSPSPDTSPVDTSPTSENTTAPFPGATAVSTCSGLCNYPGWRVEESFTRTLTVKKLYVDVTVVDGTCGCAIGATTRIAVKLNGTKVGELSFVSSSVCGSGVAYRNLDDTFVLASPLAPIGGKVAVALEALTGVCGGGGQWTLKSGAGSVVMD